MKLYHVTTVAPEFRGHRDVQLNWFVTHRAFPEERPYAELVEDYDPDGQDSSYCRDAIDEMFTADEAASLTGWLHANRGRRFGDDEVDRAMDGATQTVEAKLPLRANIIGLGAIPIGGAIDWLEIGEIAVLAKSPLGFAAEGYYDLRAHEPLDKSVPARHQFCSLYLMDGRVISDHAELLDLWRAGRIEAEDEATRLPRLDAPGEAIPF